MNDIEAKKKKEIHLTELELLAPAKNLECGIAAIDHGADAVYIGAPRFGARAAAANSLEDIKKLCDYAHQFRAKVHVTVNTIIYENDIQRPPSLSEVILYTNRSAELRLGLSTSETIRQLLF